MKPSDHVVKYYSAKNWELDSPEVRADIEEFLNNGYTMVPLGVDNIQNFHFYFIKDKNEETKQNTEKEF